MIAMYFEGRTLEWPGPVSRPVEGRAVVQADSINEATAKLIHALKLRTGSEPTIVRGFALFPVRGPISGSLRLDEVRRTTIEDFFYQHLLECKDCSGELGQARLLLEQRQEERHDAATE